MKNKKNSNIAVISNEELRLINGGGPFCRRLGELIGHIKNVAEDFLESMAEFNSIPHTHYGI